ncbi:MULTISPECIES: condensation domain-containing protein [unclassified Streptomyces]|uniref:condensation domain-containing protein n=1 Tax=unclassified Streptomyces TaxID=2593676 RepID=UPI000DAC6F22|nr:MULTISPECIES: condensation domain-containing protein [unclassified Streptomyces]PZT71666.1 peptide synthase condensation domain-containing protein [Streptomyces sp. AC1-42T]PZT73208.1 peptide synthase condensation domain-containing protein [Streptomyces sp. AC1-42W]
MTTDHSLPTASARATPGGPMTVVLGLDGPDPAAPVLELRGPVDPHRVEAALDRLARLVTRPAPAWRPSLEPGDDGHHTLRLTPDGPAAAPFPAGLLADLLTVAESGPGPAPRIEPTPLQRELLADADAHPGTEGWCEQLAVTWSGPLDPERLAAAWQSVAERESVLRAAFEEGPEPWIVCHEGAGPEVLRFPYGSVDWHALVEADRRRGLDPRRPGPLRVTFLGGGPDAAGSTRVLLSFHPALLDDWSVRLLLHEFYRAYLAGGELPGGARRPDLGDYTRWLAAQDTAPAREFWRDAPPGPAATLPPAGDGSGQVRTRITPEESERLAAWAGGLGCPESSALHAVWALALYRAGGHEGAADIGFSAAVSGRGILLDGVERLPAALRNPLPMTAGVHPYAPLAELPARLRDQALDVAGYEWVSQGRIRSWTRPGGRAAPDVVATAAPNATPNAAPAVPRTGSLVVFENRPRPPGDLAPALAALGVRVSTPDTLGARTGFPLTLVAHRDDEGGLVLTATCLGTGLAQAEDLLTRTAHALRELPRTATPATTVGGALALLAGPPDRIPRGRPGARRGAALTELRPAAHPGTGTVCLVRAPGTPLSALTRVAYAYRGPEGVVLLRPPPYADASAPADDAVVVALTGLGGPLVLGAFCGGGERAHALAGQLVAAGSRPPGVVLTGTTTPAGAFAHTLEAVVRRIR